jgi:uncharacterized protein YjiS (DUF1127 family)
MRVYFLASLVHSLHNYRERERERKEERKKEIGGRIDR